MKRGLISRAVRAAAAVVLAVGGLTVLGAGQAQAYSCSHGSGEWIFGPNGVSKVDLFMYWGCSDGKQHWNGTLYDTKCDAHAARLIIAGDPTYAPDNPFGMATFDWRFSTSNGCGTSSTFSGSGKAYSYIRAGVGNCNSWELTCGYTLVTYQI